MQKVLIDLLSKSVWAILCFLCSVCLTQLHKLKKVNKKRKDDLDLIKEALRHTLRNVLISDYEKFKNRGWCSHLEKEEYTATYNTYHNLNGNGVVTHKNEDVLNLPDRPPSGD